MNELHTLIEQIFEEPLFDIPFGRIPYASAKLGNCVVNHVCGLENPFFFLGLLLSFSTIYLMYPLEILLKFVLLGMYCLTSPFMFSMPPFPRAIWMCKVNRGAQFPCDDFMCCKLHPVVGGYGPYRHPAPFE